VSTPEDPKRLADAAPRSPLGDLLASAARDLPTDEQLARLASQLGPVLNGAPKPAATRIGASGLTKAVVVTGALAALVAAGLVVHHSQKEAVAPAPPSRTPQPVTAPASAPAIDLTPTTPSAPTTANDDGSPTHPPEAANSGPAKSAAVPSKALSEAALLEQARRALDTSPSYALQLANQHRTRFPNGLLTQEREVIAIEALRRLHRTTEADQRAAGFSKAFPGSAHQRMVDEAAPK